jgi:hypothetical protein
MLCWWKPIRVTPAWPAGRPPGRTCLTWRSARQTQARHAGATVIWTRHRLPPDLTPQIPEWFATSGFAEIAFETPETMALISVGVNRLRRAPAQTLPDHRLFTFGAG